MKNGKIRTVIDEKIVPLAEEKKRYGENFLAVKLEMLHDLAIPNEKLCYAIKHLAKHNIAVTGLDEEVFCDTDSYKIVSEYNMYISKYSDENMVKKYVIMNELRNSIRRECENNKTCLSRRTRWTRNYSR